MTGWAVQFTLVFLAICALMLGAIVIRVVRALERAVHAVERIGAATREPEPDPEL